MLLQRLFYFISKFLRFSNFNTFFVINPVKNSQWYIQYCIAYTKEGYWAVGLWSWWQDNNCCTCRETVDAVAACTVIKILALFAVFDWWRYCKPLCDKTFSQIERNGWKFSHSVPCNRVINYIFQQCSSRFFYTRSADPVLFLIDPGPNDHNARIRMLFPISNRLIHHLVLKILYVFNSVSAKNIFLNLFKSITVREVKIIL